MRIKKIKNEATQIPDDLTIRHLCGSVYEIIRNDKVVAIEEQTEEGKTTIYKSEMTHITCDIKSREEMVAALIRSKYSQNDEFALINKGLIDKNNTEYLSYRNFVSVCKEQSFVYFNDTPMQQ